MRSIKTLLLLNLGLFSSLGFSTSLRSFDHLSVVDINVQESGLELSAGYPSLWDAPDCINLVSDEPIWLVFDLEKLGSLLTVEDGPGILFNDSTPGGINQLTPVIQARLQYNFKDIGTYVTGLRIKTVDGSTLRAVLEASLHEGHTLPQFVALLRSADCEIR